jgi:hypothetical protein
VLAWGEEGRAVARARFGLVGFLAHGDFSFQRTRRGISVRPGSDGPHIGKGHRPFPSHRESLLRLAPAQLWG